MKPFRIDLEKVSGASVVGQTIEITGSMTIEQLGPFERGHESTICLELQQAINLLQALTASVKIALDERG